MHRGRMLLPLALLAMSAGAGASVGGEPITLAATRREPMPVAAVASASAGPRKSSGSRASKRRQLRRRGWR